MEDLAWEEEGGVLEFEGRAVLNWSVKMPVIAASKRGGKWLQRYYSKVVKVWKRRWFHEMYGLSCLESLEKTHFEPWEMSLAGEWIPLEHGRVSVALTVVEKSGKKDRFYFGDLWQGAVPVSAKECSPFQNLNRKEIVAILQQQGETWQDFAFLSSYLTLIDRCFSYKNICFRPEGAEVFFPQGSIAGRVEGVVKFLIPYS